MMSLRDGHMILFGSGTGVNENDIRSWWGAAHQEWSTITENGAHGALIDVSVGARMIRV